GTCRNLSASSVERDQSSWDPLLLQMRNRYLVKPSSLPGVLALYELRLLRGLGSQNAVACGSCPYLCPCAGYDGLRLHHRLAYLPYLASQACLPQQPSSSSSSGLRGNVLATC